MIGATKNNLFFNLKYYIYKQLKNNKNNYLNRVTFPRFVNVCPLLPTAWTSYT